MQCVIQGSAGFRCVSRIFDIIHRTLSRTLFPTPVFSTARDWLLKLGLFNLTQPCQGGEWIWIIDSSIQMGAMKCLLIIGVQMKVLQARKNFTLSHSDVKPIVLKTVESCPGEVVKEALNEAKRKTNGAIAIVSDEGSEMKRGVRLFQQEQVAEQRPIHLHDIMHKQDLLLKKELERDSDWKNFTKHMMNTTQQLKLSSSSHLIPPKQRKKNRMRSEIDVVEWGIKILSYLDSGKANTLEKERLSWVLDYRSQLTVYQEMAIFFDMSSKEVREQGYHQRTIETLKERGNLISSSERSRSFFSKIHQTIEEEVRKIPQGKQLLGSTEVIESVFGKFKQLEKNHASDGLTSLVLSLPALLGDITVDKVITAMEKISIGKVKEWIETNLGETFCSKRRDNQKDKSYRENYLDQDELLEKVVG